MSELKPIGSEKLKGNEKMKRILELTYYNEVEKKPQTHVKAEFVSESKNGVYGIVREHNDYYVKKGLNEESLDYIGGLFMKNKNKFSSYAEAFKRLDLLQGQENLQEEKRFVLKTKAKPAPAPVEAPVAPAEAPLDDAGLDDLGSEAPVDNMGGEAPVDDMGGEDEEFGIKGIQKLTGKLGEKLRESSEEIESEDIKFVLNSIISAVDLTILDEDDKADIVSKLEDDVEDDTMGRVDFSTGDQELPDELGDEDLNELNFDRSDDDEEEIDFDFSKYALDEDGDFTFDSGPTMDDDKSTPMDGEMSPMDAEMADMGDEEEGVKEFDLDELKSAVNQAISDNLGNYFK